MKYVISCTISGIKQVYANNDNMLLFLYLVPPQTHGIGWAYVIISPYKQITGAASHAEMAHFTFNDQINQFEYHESGLQDYSER